MVQEWNFIACYRIFIRILFLPDSFLHDTYERYCLQGFFLIEVLFRILLSLMVGLYDQQND